MSKKKRNEMIKRYIIFMIGLFVNSIGVSFVTKAKLGTSPISAVPYVLSLNYPFTLGEFTIAFSLVLILLQMVLLGKNFKLEHWLQIPVSLLFGYFIDFSMMFLGFVNPKVYISNLIYLIIGCVILGIGVYMEILANVIMLPGESFVRAVVYRWKTEFGITKICFDVSVSVIATVMSFVFAGKLNGVREGTIIAALLVGYIARIIGKKLKFLPEKLFGYDEQIKTESADEDSAVCICIGRQYGSGGRVLAKKLAEEMGYDFYDREIIKMTANMTGYSEEYIDKHEEKMSSRLLYDLEAQMYDSEGKYSSSKDTIFAAEAKVIQKAAEKNSVIVGRCADWVLRNQKNCIRVFLTAPVEERIKRVMEREDISQKEAEERIRQIDRYRSENYKYYTGKKWGESSNYHICIDTSLGEKYVLQTVKNILDIAGE